MTRTKVSEQEKKVKHSEALKTIWCTVWIIIMHFAVAPAFSVYVYLSRRKLLAYDVKTHHDIIRSDIIPKIKLSFFGSARNASTVYLSELF